MNKQQQQMAVLAVMIVGGGGYFYVMKWFLPLRKEIVAKRLELEEKKKILNEAKAQEMNLKKLQKEAEGFDQRMYVTHVRLPSKEAFHMVLSDITRAEKKSVVVLSPLTPQGEAGTAEYIEVPFKALMQATMPSLGSFMNHLHGLTRMFVVRNIQLSFSRTPSKTASVNVDLEFSTFRMRGDEPKQPKNFDLASVKHQPETMYDSGVSRDPFVPLTSVELAELSGGVNILKLELMAIVNMFGKKMALMQDGVNRIAYKLKEGRLYERTANGEALVRGVSGTIQKENIVLWQQDTKTGEKRKRILKVEEVTQQ